jgi:hypothetical protein
MNLQCWAIMARFVLTSILVYLLIAINVPEWVIKAIDKIRRAFLCERRKEANGRCCLVAWEEMALQYDLGGLGIPNFLVMD